MMRTLQAERGLSLIELLVALVISSLLVLGIVQIYVDNRSNYLFQQGQSDNNENARYTLLILEEELRRAGYRINPDSDPRFVFRAEIVGQCTFTEGEVINFDPAAQRICLRYEPYLPGISACDGIAQAGPDEPYDPDTNIPNLVVDMTYFGNELQCNGQSIVNGLVDFQLEFGVSNNGSRQTELFTFSPSAGEEIQSVRFAALMKSRYENLAENTDSLAYETWYETRYGTVGATAPDRALYLVTENTVNLRNLSR
ncbi:MAG: hypothetical protein CVV07_04605 [Gammaproteobacteria bacterium HGW-Gammaproteobacteria-11]|nr:MAG: hypothetical protein CVV07_04605 [Gammaproteobacteria bacterium HGW-Gammaproteobacteria-11]